MTGKITSTSAFLERSSSYLVGIFVVSNPELLLRENPHILWILLHLRQLVKITAKFLFVSSRASHEFSTVLDGIHPLCYRIPTLTQPLEIIRKFSQRSSLIRLDKSLINLEQRSSGMKSTTLKTFLEKIYTLGKDRISNTASLLELARKILPLYIATSRERKSNRDP